MREHGVPQFTVDGHRPVGAFDVLGVSFATELGYTNMLDRARPGRHPAARGDRDDEHPIVLAGGHAAFNPEPIADFIDAAVLGDGEQAVARDHRRDPGVEGRGLARRPRRAAAAAGRAGGVYVPALLRRGLPARRPDPAGRAQPAGRAVPGAQAHRDGPRRVAVPEAAAGAAGRDGARAHERGDLPRLHPRLPVLPGRDDHPAGARAVDHRHRRDGRAGLEATGFEEVGLLSLSTRRPLRDRRRRQGPGRPLRGHQHVACRCPPPGSTRSTSTWPTSCPATAGAPG